MTWRYLTPMLYMGVVFLALVLSGCNSESRRIRNLELPRVDLAQIEDGTYTGGVSHHGTLYSVNVTVDQGEITEIQVLSSQGDEYDQKALAVLDRVIAQQDLCVDAVSGATKSSKLYLIAIHNALTGKEIDF